jgi:hypothetical protein
VFEKTSTLNVKVNSVGHYWDMAEQFWTEIIENWIKNEKKIP